MEIEELDLALGELEVRLDRLRALYEQYFLGIERIEPAILRKDVDRRIFVLRREKIRNTGRRFKLQTLIQRYNTFQQYWQRICREIENGTYKRHLARAERRLGPSELLTAATRRRFGMERDRPSPEDPDGSSAALAPEGLPQDPAWSSVPPPASRPRSPAPPRLQLPRPPTRAPGPRVERPTLPRAMRPEQPVLPQGSLPQTAAAAPKVDRAPSDRSGAQKAPPPKPKSYESLELDMDFMQDWDPARPQRVAPQIVTPRVASRITSPGVAPPSPGVPSPPIPASPALPAVQPRVAPMPPGAGATRSLKRPAPPVPNTRKHAPSAEVGARPAGNAAVTALSEDRLRSLHDRLNEANQKANQPSVSLEGLSRSLRAAETKLRAQYGSRRIDFEVLVKDGKPVVKPTVR